MEIIISGRHLGVTDEMKTYAEERLGKLSSEYGKLTTARVVMDLERNWHVVELHLSGKHLNLEAAAKTPDMYISVDTAVDKLERQLRRYVDRLQDHRGGPRLDELEPVLEEADQEEEPQAVSE